MTYIQKNSPLKQDAKFMIKQYDKTRQNMSASGEKAFKKGQSEAAITAASFVPIGKVVGGVVKLAKGITNLSKASKIAKKGSGLIKGFKNVGKNKTDFSKTMIFEKVKPPNPNQKYGGYARRQDLEAAIARRKRDVGSN